MSAKFELRMPNEGLRAVAILTELKPQLLDLLVAIVAGSHPRSELDAIIAEVSEKVGVGLPESQQVVAGMIIPIAGLARRYDATAESVIEAITEALERDAPSEWRESYLSSWKAISFRVGRLFEKDSGPRIISKALELATVRPAFLVEARVVTEARPVFDEDASSIRTAAINSTLVVEYRGSRPEQRDRLYIAVTLEQLEELGKEANRAAVKHRTLEDFFVQHVEVEA